MIVLLSHIRLSDGVDSLVLDWSDCLHEDIVLLLGCSLFHDRFLELSIYLVVLDGGVRD